MMQIELNKIQRGGLCLSATGISLPSFMIGIGGRTGDKKQPPHLLLEDGGGLLLENGESILLESYEK